jgi:hypothetical protein
MAKDPQHQPRRKEAGGGLDQLGDIHKRQTPDAGRCRICQSFTLEELGGEFFYEQDGSVADW